MKFLVIITLAILSAACTTVFERADGTFDVPRAVEVRSPLGTNAGFVKLEHCTTKVNKVSWSNPFALSTYTNCHRQEKWQLTQSQGQGGQLAAGAMVGLGFGLGGLTMPANSTTAVSSSASHATASAVAKGGHH
jgi:hypothetical protein